MTSDKNSGDEENDRVKININEDSSEDTEDETNEDSDRTESILGDDGTVRLNSDDYSGSLRLVGTVHVSRKTRDRVLSAISEDEPDVVSIELDRERLNSMFERESQIVVGGESSQDEQGLRDLMRSYRENQFESEDMLKPGEADMLPAVNKSTELGCRVALMDMSMSQLKENVKDNAYDEDGSLDIEILNKSFGEFVESVKSLVRSRSEMAENIRGEDGGISSVVENMENASLEEVNQQMEPLREVAPEVVEALIDERDRFMAGHLHWLRQNGYDVVGVMGRGHLSGVYDYLTNPEDIPEDYVQKPDWYSYTSIEIGS